MRQVLEMIVSVICFLTFIGISEAKGPRCFNKDANLTKLAQRLLKRTPRHRGFSVAHEVLSSTESRPKIECSQMKLDDSSGKDSDRSVSPWRLSNNHDGERYPADISVAECLCEGCIINGRENRSYNSVPVMYSKHVLKKFVCPYNRTMYTFKVLSVSMPIACTCVRPRSLPNLS